MAEPVDHRRVGVGPHEGIGERHRLAPFLLREHSLGEVLEIHLVHDARGRGHHSEPLEGLLAPPQELVPLPVALELDVGIALNRVG
jgi:hypothetical protein